MRFTRTTILAGGAALLLAGTAAAAAEKLHRINVALPDGSVAQVEYTGDVAPKVAVVPVDVSPIAFDPFAGFEQLAAAMEAQQQAMMQQIAAMQQAASRGEALPAGVHYSYVSSTTDANGCTQTVQYSSDGGAATPKVTRASSGNCDAVKPQGPVDASAPAAAADSRPGLKV